MERTEATDHVSPTYDSKIGRILSARSSLWHLLKEEDKHDDLEYLSWLCLCSEGRLDEIVTGWEGAAQRHKIRDNPI